MFKGRGKKRDNKKSIEFIKGPNLEEEMDQDKEPQYVIGDIELENEKATKKWHYYALGEGPDEEPNQQNKEKEIYFRMDEPTEQENERHVELCTISPRGHPIAPSYHP